MKKTLIVLILGMTSSMVMGQTVWTDEYRNLYMKSCVDEASRNLTVEVSTTYCGCTMQKIEKKYPDVNDALNIAESEMTALVNECIAELGIDFSTTTTASTATKTYAGATTWSQTTFDAYMNACVVNASSTMGESGATTYCACTAEKMQKEFPDETMLLTITEAQIQPIAEGCLK